MRWQDACCGERAPVRLVSHQDAGTAQRFYIMTFHEDVKDAMKQLETRMARAAGFGEVICKLLKSGAEGES
jgi:hypothetical protein